MANYRLEKTKIMTDPIADMLTRIRNANNGQVVQNAVTGAIGAMTSILMLYLLFQTARNTKK